MKAPVDELLATEIVGHVAVVVTEVVAAADGLARWASLGNPVAGNVRSPGAGRDSASSKRDGCGVRSLDVFHGATKPKKEQGDASGARNWSE
ncbi:hypothetical protein LGN21_36660 [Burkholderia cepacia]|uniref:hypothetical protein n=1 Tax=Burkholderia cepacia TaxID=292 RepID=UPI001CF1BE02|nr:hypothetical protein [Burkholderia cepacia]MCA8285131.1 hypothetical protein [Burkholderia cepacia]